jgi:O-antigen/teichoic acid export membrane protein
VALCMLVLAILGAPLALTLFGEDFAAGAVPLSILCLSLVVRAATGPASVVLSIHDRPWASLPAIGLGLVSLYGANLIFVPLWGLVGAASAALLAISLWSAALWLTALRMARVDVSIMQWFRARRALIG